jgi:hypothetical protein
MTKTTSLRPHAEMPVPLCVIPEGAGTVNRWQEGVLCCMPVPSVRAGGMELCGRSRAGSIKRVQRFSGTVIRRE